MNLSEMEQLNFKEYVSAEGFYWASDIKKKVGELIHELHKLNHHALTWSERNSWTDDKVREMFGEKLSPLTGTVEK